MRWREGPPDGRGAGRRDQPLGGFDRRACGSGRADPAQRKHLDELTERVAKAVEASIKGDNHLLYQVNGEPGPYEDFDRENRDVRQRMERNNGALKGFAVIGTGPGGVGLATYVRMEFERGVRFVEYGWDGPFVGQILVLDRVPGRTFLPQSATELAAFDPRSGQTLRLRLDGGDLVLRAPMTSFARNGSSEGGDRSRGLGGKHRRRRPKRAPPGRAGRATAPPRPARARGSVPGERDVHAGFFRAGSWGAKLLGA